MYVVTVAGEAPSKIRYKSHEDVKSENVRHSFEHDVWVYSDGGLQDHAPGFDRVDTGVDQ